MSIHSTNNALQLQLFIDNAVMQGKSVKIITPSTKPEELRGKTYDMLLIEEAAYLPKKARKKLTKKYKPNCTCELYGHCDACRR